MKKTLALIFVFVLMACLAGCVNGNDNKDEWQSQSKLYEWKSHSKLVELEKYSTMTIDGTTSIEVVYDYIKEEETTYEFVIDDQEIIGKIMTQVFNMELKDYPEDQDIDFYQRWITVNQGNNEYYVSLAYTSDENGNKYLCQSQKVCEIIEQYIEEQGTISELEERISEKYQLENFNLMRMSVDVADPLEGDGEVSYESVLFIKGTYDYNGQTASWKRPLIFHIIIFKHFIRSMITTSFIIPS